MEIVIKLTAAELALAAKQGSLTAVVNGATVPSEAPKKRGRPSKAEVEAREAADTDEDEEAEEDEDETPAPKKKTAKKAAAKKKAADEDEEADDEEADEDEDEESDDEEVEDEAEEDFVTGADLKKLKAALSAFSKAKGSKDAAVKVLRKFAASSEKVTTADLPKLLKALKV